mgnify:CR=1
KDNSSWNKESQSNIHFVLKVKGSEAVWKIQLMQFAPHFSGDDKF